MSLTSEDRPSYQPAPAPAPTKQVIRVVRFMEYAYADVETMVGDMANWHVQSAYRPNAKISIRSATLPLDILPAPAVE